MNINIRISCFEILRYFIKCVFLTMGSSDGEGLSQLYLQLVDTYLSEKIYDLNWASRRIKVLSNMEENEKTF